MKKVIYLLMVLSIVANISVFAAEDSQCVPCETIVSEEYSANEDFEAILPIVVKSFSNSDVVKNSKEGEFRFDANKMKAISNEEFDLLKIPLIYKTNGEKFGNIYFAYDYETKNELVFKIEMADKNIVLTNLTKDTNESVVLWTESDAISFQSSPDMSCEAKCNAIVSAIGCYGFCALFGVGYAACQPVCSAAMALFCNDYCNGSAQGYYPYIPDCGIEGLPDCVK